MSGNFANLSLVSVSKKNPDHALRELTSCRSFKLVCLILASLLLLLNPNKRTIRRLGHRIKIHIEGPCTYVGSFEVSVLAHVALRMLAAIFLASQWHFLANKRAVLAGCSAFWPVNCIFLHKKTRTRCTAEWPFCY
jgi:hypothetical protein